MKQPTVNANGVPLICVGRYPGIASPTSFCTCAPCEASRPPERKPAEVGWLIERKDFTGRAMWWCGHEAGNVWSHDSLLAIRFSRECDAANVARTIRHPGAITITEHSWSGLEDA